MGMSILGDTIEKLRKELHELMQSEAAWSSGKVLSLSQKLDILIASHYITDKSV
jgi:hypothetical protein